MNHNILFFLILLSGCAVPKEVSKLDALYQYEGRYEYVDNGTLDIVASPLDTVIYAVIDEAKYPLRHINKDTFANIQDVPVIFQRNEAGAVSGYLVDNQTFKLITTDFERMEMSPRKELRNDPDLYVYQQPEGLNDGIDVGALDSAFVNPEQIVEMVKSTIAGAYPDVHSILIFKGDQLVLEEYFYGYERSKPHQLRSAGKSLKGSILGIAIDKGFVGSENDPLLPYFKSKYPEIANIDDRKRNITIRDFLMYRHGMDCENDNPNSEGNEQTMMQSEDWVKHTLDLPMVAEKGKASSYCTGCSLTINSLIEIAIGQNIEDFAKEHLFDPLGISNYQWTFEPNPSSMTTFNQLYITPRDLLKMAIMYKEGGLWKGQRIVSQSWIDKTFTMDKGDYGFFWEHKYFVIDGKQYDSYLATGNGGQKINIWPQLDMITIFTGGNYNSYALYGKSTPPNEMIPKYILKAIE